MPNLISLKPWKSKVAFTQAIKCVLHNVAIAANGNLKNDLKLALIGFKGSQRAPLTYLLQRSLAEKKSPKFLVFSIVALKKFVPSLKLKGKENMFLDNLS